MTKKTLAAIVSEFCPNGTNGLADEIWSVLRRAGEHRLADRLTHITNEMREQLSPPDEDEHPGAVRQSWLDAGHIESREEMLANDGPFED